MLADSWKYVGSDGCIRFFDTCIKAAQPPMDAAGSVLEIGCAEADWIGPARTSWPAMSFTGIDWRHVPRKNATVIRGDVCKIYFPPASFDLIVSVSAIEHIGLHHYKNDENEKDPEHTGGDVITMNKAWDWLKPGGWLYFDVPWNVQIEPFDAYVVAGTSHRVYDDASVELRLQVYKPWIQHWSGCAFPGLETQLVEEPKRLEPIDGRKFYYRGFWWGKPL